MSTNNLLTNADIVIIAAYIGGVIAVGIWSMFQSKRGTVDGYFLAGRFMKFLPVGMSLFASNIGSEHLVGLAGSGAAAGIGVAAFEINALMFLQLLGFVFLPVYISSGVFTLPEYIHKRFGGQRIRLLLSFLSLLLYIFTKISVNMYSGALFIQQSVGWDLYVSILLLLGLTGVCTLTGGLAAVIYMDTMMAFVMLGGSSVMTYLGFQKIGGYAALRTMYMNAIAKEVIAGNTTCGIPRSDSFQLMRDPIGSDIPWPGFLFGQTTASIWYWCADQVIVQRALAAKSLSHAQGATILAGYIKILPLFIMVMPGMISRVLFPDEVACVDPEKCYAICESHTGCTNIAIPKLVMEIMPSGLRGMMLAVMMAALMSDLTSIFNSASTLFTLDIYRRIRKGASSRELLLVGRLFILFLCVVGVCWVPIVKDFGGGQIFIYVQAISSYLSPPISAVYLLAIFWKRSNEQGTFWAMIFGFVLGIARMVLDFLNLKPRCGQKDNRIWLVKDIHYMYFALILFSGTIIVCVVVSLCTQPPDEEHLIRTTVWTRHDQTIRGDELAAENDFALRNEQENRSRLTSDLDESQIKLRGMHQNGTTEEETISISMESRATGCRKIVNFICGLTDDIEEKEQSMAEQKEHLKEVISMKQDTCAKHLLLVNLVVILCVSLFLFIFFSIPDGGPTMPTVDIGQ